MNPVIIFDEIHLFFYWGDSFRPRLIECLESIIYSTPYSVLFLTATLHENLIIRLTHMISAQRKIYLPIDIGNCRMRFPPTKHVELPKWTLTPILFYLLDHKLITQNILIFCRYRQEVLDLEANLKSYGHHVLSCLGGESMIFLEKLKNNPNPSIIIATSVLGHGVNLPSCQTIFMTYHEDNPDFKLQMMARGGRMGEGHVVYSPISWKKETFISALKTCINDLYQCNLAILYGLLFYPLNGHIEKGFKHDVRRLSSGKNALSRAPLNSDSLVTSRNPIDSFIFWWRRWWQTSQGN